MKVLMCGSRGWNNREYMVKVMTRLVKEGMTKIIAGGAGGADMMASKIAQEMGLGMAIVPAKWAEYGKAAGPIRNGEMLKHEPDLVVAFYRGFTRGTQDMIQKAKDREIATEIHWESEKWPAHLLEKTEY